MQFHVAHSMHLLGSAACKNGALLLSATSFHAGAEKYTCSRLQHASVMQALACCSPAAQHPSVVSTVSFFSLRAAAALRRLPLVEPQLQVPLLLPAALLCLCPCCEEQYPSLDPCSADAAISCCYPVPVHLASFPLDSGRLAHHLVSHNVPISIYETLSRIRALVRIF